MKVLLVCVLSVCFLGCSSSSKKEAVDQSQEEVADSTRQAVQEVSESGDTVVDESVILGNSCAVKANRSTIDFGSRKVTSRAFQRLRLKSRSSFRVTSVSTFEKPFGFYNSGEFPGEATYKDYELCSYTSETTGCSLNLEFRPTAISEYNSRIVINYIDTRGDNCSIEVGLTGISTESYLGDDNSRGN